MSVYLFSYTQIAFLMTVQTIVNQYSGKPTRTASHTGRGTIPRTELTRITGCTETTCPLNIALIDFMSNNLFSCQNKLKI